MNNYPFAKTAMLGIYTQYWEVTVTISIEVKVGVFLIKFFRVDMTNEIVVVEPLYTIATFFVLPSVNSTMWAGESASSIDESTVDIIGVEVVPTTVLRVMPSLTKAAYLPFESPYTIGYDYYFYVPKASVIVISPALKSLSKLVQCVE